MVYLMELAVDGGCRGNHRTGDRIAAAAAILYRRRYYYTRVEQLPSTNPQPTSQRAEIAAVIVALKWVLEKYDELSYAPELRVKIYSDSSTIVNSMNNWIYYWEDNDYYNSRGRRIANRDLWRRAFRLDLQVERLGTVEYIWVPREENEEADEAVNDCLDEMAYERRFQY